ncbi:non-homologous end joining protein Ku [Streptacidiphilus sp. MAP12-33]|uniref:hypothetical protein n=1 Tax=Streptacidiphilus sp. MAP12-33 TaxID=3156266 RepID=UPI0035128718
MVLQLAEAKGEGDDLDEERDAYVVAMQELLSAKAGGDQVKSAAEPAVAGAPLVDIMAALKASIAETQAQREAAAAPAKKTTAKKTAKRSAPKRAS